MMPAIEGWYYERLAFILLLFTDVCIGSLYQETKTEVCYNDVFRANCPYTQQILITQAKYGHIEVSRCVAEMFASFGTLGCYANVADIISKRCGGKQRCDITMPDTEIIATKTCPTGLPMYLDVTYVCIPETVQPLNCESVRVDRRVQYLTSDQIQKGSCVHSQDGVSKQASFTAGVNMKIKFTFGVIKKFPSARNETLPDGYIVDNVHGTSAVQFPEDQDSTDSVTYSNTVDLVIADKPSHLFTISFLEIGCSDLAPPPYTWMKRKKDATTIGCHNNNNTWQLKCEGSNWIGSTGNCTNEVKVVVHPKTPVKETIVNYEEKKEMIPKEILFALIIGVTVFLCAVVITIGFVCLKCAKYKTKAVGKNSMEMNTILLDGEGTTSWTRVRSMNGQPTVNNQWQQTIKSQGAPGNQKYYILDREDVNTLRT